MYDERDSKLKIRGSADQHLRCLVLLSDYENFSEKPLTFLVEMHLF
jgi:hypothetical protein